MCGTVYDAAATRPDSGILIVLLSESVTMMPFIRLPSTEGSIVTLNVAGVVVLDSDPDRDAASVEVSQRRLALERHLRSAGGLSSWIVRVTGADTRADLRRTRAPLGHRVERVGRALAGRGDV